jgi:hypothetical protein
MARLHAHSRPRLPVQQDFNRLREKYAPLIDEDLAHVERVLAMRRGEED